MDAALVSMTVKVKLATWGYNRFYSDNGRVRLGSSIWDSQLQSSQSSVGKVTGSIARTQMDERWP